MSAELGVAGVDPSCVRTAIARVDGSLVCIEPGRRAGQVRLAYVYAATLEALEGADVVLLEGYPFGVRGKGQRSLAEVKGVIVLAADHACGVVVDVNPSTLKVYATGKGDASKHQMLEAAVAAGGRPANDDEADAMWLRAMGRHRYLRRAPSGTAVGMLVAARQRALRTVRWPPPDALSGSVRPPPPPRV